MNTQDVVIGDGNEHFRGTPAEVEQFLLENTPLQSCLVWVASQERYVSGFVYLEK